MTTRSTLARVAMLSLALSGAGSAHALDCEIAARNAQDLYVAKASKDDTTYASLKESMLAHSSDQGNVYTLLVRVVDEGLYASPESMHKAALKFCTRKLAAN